MDTPGFTPATPRARFGGWTPARQAGFIVDLSTGHTVLEACARVGLTPRSVYLLRRHPSAGEFALAWDAAIDAGRGRLRETAIDRVLNGVTKPVIYRGRTICTRTTHNDRLLMFMLKRQRALGGRRMTPLAQNVSPAATCEACEVSAPLAAVATGIGSVIASGFSSGTASTFASFTASNVASGIAPAFTGATASDLRHGPPMTRPAPARGVTPPRPLCSPA